MIGTIPLDIFNLEVGVFASDEDRVRVLVEEGCDVEPHDPAALSSAHLDHMKDGYPRLSLVIKPEATKAPWAHECVHIADFAMLVLGIPAQNTTEIRAYLVGHLFAGLEEIL